MAKDDEALDAIGGCASAVGKVLLQIALIPWAAFVAWTIWRWFAVQKLGLMPVPFAAMGGLMEGVGLLRLRAVTNKTDEVTVGGILGAHVLVPALILGIARIWLVFA